MLGKMRNGMEKKMICVVGGRIFLVPVEKKAIYVAFFLLQLPPQ